MPYGLTDKQRETTAIQQLPEVTIEADEVFATMRDGQRPPSDVAAEVMLTIADDPKHLGARIGATLVLHTWGSALTHHPHVHGIVPGNGHPYP